MSAFGVKRRSGGGRLSFICAPSTSRGHDGERAFHLLLNALNGANADANLAGNFDDAVAGPQLILDALFNLLAYARATQRLAGFHGAFQASVDALADHRTFKLGERAGYLEHQAASW